ncbi:hypothetical protein Emed_006918 [Eimeria media]
MRRFSRSCAGLKRQTRHGKAAITAFQNVAGSTEDLDRNSPKPRLNRPTDVARMGGGTNKPFKPHVRDEERKPDSSSCFTCGGKGHRQRQCPNPQMGDRADGANCNRCGGRGHWAVLCPSPPPTDYVIRPRENRGVKTEAANKAQRGNGSA